MSDDVEQIAAAQVNAFGGDTPGIEFNSNDGFETASRSSAGVYVLELDHEHGVEKLVISALRNSAAAGSIGATIIDRKHVQVSTFDGAGSPVDVGFYVSILRVRD
jgi:hypothetical protein